MRIDFERIAACVPRDGAVLDLGCGGGELLAFLRDSRGADGVGADIDGANLAACLQKKVRAVHCDIREGLSLFSDGAFDVVVLSDTMQGIRTPPQRLLAEMLRVGRSAVVSFPNFGYWRMRFALLSGRMPVGRALPHQWYNTPNMRYCTIDDFESLCGEENFHIQNRVFLCAGAEIKFAPNLRAETAIYHLSRKSR